MPPHRPLLASTYASLQPGDFDTLINGRRNTLYTLRNQHGMQVSITNYGARVVQMLVPDHDGQLADVVQGYPNIEQTMQGQASMGAFIGRYANRISKGQFDLDGQHYSLAINDVAEMPARHNTIHGGPNGSRGRVFEATQHSQQLLDMRLLFRQEDDGFPGDVQLTVRYAIDEDSLSISFFALAGAQVTATNFTNHIFWNLSGDLSASIDHHQLLLPAPQILELTPQLVPSGRLLDVAGTAMDFTLEKAIGRDIAAAHPALLAAGGYDAYYILPPVETPTQRKKMRLHAKLREPQSGRCMTLWSDQPGLQFYSGNFLAGAIPRDIGKNGASYGKRSAFALEPSHYPDSLNHPSFPSTVLLPGQSCHGQMRFQFSNERGD